MAEGEAVMTAREAAEKTAKRLLKEGALGGLTLLGVDRLFRYLNRHKLLVVMYHGVTAREYDEPVWTQLPLEVFRRQLCVLKERYQVVTLDEVLAAVEGRGTIPERAALITFDDGIRNNYSVAFPLLRELGLPASIFLTVDLIGTQEILWFDELFLLMREGARNGVALTLPEDAHRCGSRLWEAYSRSVEALKRAGAARREAFLQELRERIPLEKERWLEDFGLLDWEQVAQMQRSGLVSFGVHTATHRILSELQETELDDEVQSPRLRVAAATGGRADAFCFPNGRPGVDFTPKHQEFLRRCGYRLAFTTEPGLFDWRRDQAMGVRRVAAGNDETSHSSYFSLSTSGAVEFFRSLLR